MLKTLTALLLLAPVTAQAFTKCDLTDIGGPGAQIAEEGSNPIVSGEWAYAGFVQADKVVILTANKSGANQQPLQTIFQGTDAMRGKNAVSTDLRLAAEGKYLYATWHYGPKIAEHLMVAVNSSHGNPRHWSPALDLGVSRGSLPQISADGSNVHIASVSKDGHTLVSSSSDNGKTFGAPVDLGKGNGEVVIASLGQDVYVAWEFGRQDQYPSVEYGVSHNNGASFTVSNISDNGKRIAHEPIFSLNRQTGRLSLVWREDLPQIATYLQSTDHGNTWSTPLTVDDDSRQVMVQDLGDKIYVSYLKDYTTDSGKDWQVQIAISSDGGKTFPEIHNLSGPTGVSKIVGDNARPVPWAGGGQVRVTGIKADGAYIWSGRAGKVNANAVYLGPGELASPQGNVALWQEPEGVVTYAYCHQ
ncbi:MAG TPA: sialidase family protein [Rhizomicrobium sp.]|nr:sialidase family protein [Rhizomicrobium sp.]